MDKNQILEILEDWNLWKKKLETGIKREKYLEQALRFFKSNVVLSIIGARRSGKSYLMRQLAKELIEKGTAKENLLIINLDSN